MYVSVWLTLDLKNIRTHVMKVFNEHGFNVKQCFILTFWNKDPLFVSKIQLCLPPD